MKKKNFSIVIPTYNDSSKFIGDTIKSCLDQNYDNYEIIVYQDKIINNVKKMIESFGSPKIKFFGGNKRLSITKNWEAAINTCKGDYIIFLGHDDAMLLHALRDLNIIINETNAKLIKYERLNFNIEHEIYLKIPLMRNNYQINSKKLINDVINFKKSYTSLPMMYNSVSSKDLIFKLKSITGKIFDSKNPDIYSGFALAYLSKKILTIGRPMAINTGTAESLGIIMNKNEALISEKEAKRKLEYLDLFKKDGIKDHKSIPNLDIIQSKVLDAFMFAKDNLFKNDTSFNYSKKKFIKKVIRFKLKRADTDWEIFYSQICKYISNQIFLKIWFEKEFKKKSLPVIKKKDQIYGLINYDTFLNIDPKKFNLKNSYDAAIFYENLLNMKKKNIKIDNFTKILITKFKTIYMILFR